MREREAFQELDYRQVFGGIAKWATEIDDAARIPEIVSRAFFTACNGRPGPVVVALPVVQVEFDPAQVSYEDLLQVFWDKHNPTTLNRQGPDIGTQYRSAIFYHSPEQEAAARASKQRLEESGRFRSPVVTEITPASTFYIAEDYHQQYLEKRGRTSCHI